MPQVPYTPVPEAPENVPERVPASLAEASGVGIGRAIAHLGQVTEGAGDKLFDTALKLQDLQNQSDARQAVIDLAKQTIPVEEKFNSQVGPNVGPEALKAHLANLESIRNNVKNSLKTEMAQKYFEQESQRWFLSSMWSAANHSTTELKKYDHATSVAYNDNLLTDIRNHPENFEDNIKVGEHQIRNVQSGQEGYRSDDPVANFKVKQFRSQAVSEVVTGMLNQGRAVQAMQFLEEHKQELEDKEYNKMESLLRGRITTDIAKNAADKHTGDMNNPDTNKNIPVQQRIEKALSDNKGLIEKNPDLKQKIEDSVRVQYSHKQQIWKDLENNRERQIWKILSDKQGAIRDLDDFLALPQGKELYNVLDDKMKLELPHKIDTFTKWREAAGNEKVYTSLRGMFGRDPLRALDFNIWDEKLPLNLNQRQQLDRIQQHVRAHPELDPHVEAAVKDVSDELRALGLDHATDKDAHDLFRGFLQDAIHIEMQAHNGRVLTQKERLEVARRILSHSGHLWWAESPFMDEPTKEQKRITMEALDKQDPTRPHTDIEVRREWFRNLWIKNVHPETVKKPSE